MWWVLFVTLSLAAAFDHSVVVDGVVLDFNLPASEVDVHAASLLAPFSTQVSERDGAIPDLGDVLATWRNIEGLSFSRLPLR